MGQGSDWGDVIIVMRITINNLMLIRRKQVHRIIPHYVVIPNSIEGV